MGSTRKSDTIKSVLGGSQYPITPKQIAYRTGIRHGTVKVYVRRMLEEREIRQPFYGYYQSVTKPMHGVGSGVWPRVHNLVLQGSSLVEKSGEWSLEFGDSRLRIQWGLKRQRVTGWVSSPRGLDLNAFELVVQRFLDVVGLDASDVMVKTAELNRDYMGLRVDGLTAVTLSDLRGSLRRIYNKRDGLRDEVKVKPRSLQEVIRLMSDGGVPVMNIVGAVERNTEIVAKMTKTMVAVLGFLERNLGK